jgi:hypothetical protein
MTDAEFSRILTSKQTLFADIRANFGFSLSISKYFRELK